MGSSSVIVLPSEKEISEALNEIRNKIIAVIGYGNQGRSQALNLRDSGLKVIVGNPKDEYRERAEHDGFEVYDVNEAVKRASIDFILIPDEVQPKVFEKFINPYLKEGDTLVFASGYNYYYGFITPPLFVDVLMIAPRMIGVGVRELYLKGMGFPVLVAIGQNFTGKADKVLLGLIEALGAFKPGGVAVKSSFREETLIDLLTEQTWAGALLYMFRTYYEVAREFGASPEAIILELYASGELEEIAKTMKEQGLFKQLKNHSRTSQYGHLTRGRLFVNEEFKKKMKEIAMSIIDGSFAKEWSLEQIVGDVHFKKLYEQVLSHEMEREEEKLYKILGRRK